MSIFAKRLYMSKREKEYKMNKIKDSIPVSLCKYRVKCMSHPVISREYYDYCSLYQEDCNLQCNRGNE